MRIQNSEIYVPFYDAVAGVPLRERMYGQLKEGEKRKRIYEIWFKGGRMSGKSWFDVMFMIECMYRDPRMSSALIAMTIEDHKSRTIRLVESVLMKMDVMKEWSWESKNNRPALVRNVNGYIQRIDFVSLPDLETAGWEPISNPVTGKTGYYGFIWADEFAKKTDSNPDADFTYVSRLKDAVKSAKNTFARFLKSDPVDDEKYGKPKVIIAYSLNPWSGENPLVTEFHQHLKDDWNKLYNDGYNLAYYETENAFRIYATTNFKINTALDEDARILLLEDKKDPRAPTMLYGMSGRAEAAMFDYELTIMEALNRGKNIPDDFEFEPTIASMDIGYGNGSPTAFYLHGFDSRYMVKSPLDTYLPTRAVVKAEYTIDPKKDFDDLETKYKKLLIYIFQLSRRFPQIRTRGLKIFIDGSATETVSLLQAYALQMYQDNPSFDLLTWVEFHLQDKKWTTKLNRENRRNIFSTAVGSYAFLVDKHECPQFYDKTAKIVSNQTEAKFDHWYDAIMYGFMEYYEELEQGALLRAKQGKPNIIKKETE